MNEVQQAAQVIIDAVVRTIDRDGHTFSTRPCSTCQAVSNLIGYNFGCVRRAAEDAERRATAKQQPQPAIAQIAEQFYAMDGVDGDQIDTVKWFIEVARRAGVR